MMSAPVAPSAPAGADMTPGGASYGKTDLFTRAKKRVVQGNVWSGSTPSPYDKMKSVNCPELKDQIIHIKGKVGIVKHPRYNPGFKLCVKDDGTIRTSNTAYIPMDDGRVLITSAPPIVDFVRAVIIETTPTETWTLYKERKTPSGQSLEWSVAYSDDVDMTLKVVPTMYEYGDMGKFESWDITQP